MLHEGLGVKEPLEQHLPRSHGHLEKRVPAALNAQLEGFTVKSLGFVELWTLNQKLRRFTRPQRLLVPAASPPLPPAAGRQR